MLISSVQFYKDNQRHPKSLMSESSTPQKAGYSERPLKHKSADLSFEGLSFYGNTQQTEEQKPKKKKNINPTYVLLGALAVFGLAMRLAPGYKKVGDFKVSELKEFLGKHDKSLENISGDLIEHLKNSKLAKNMIKFNPKNPDSFALYKKTIPQLIWDGLIYPFTQLPADILNGSIELLGKIKPLKNWSEKTLATDFFKSIRQRSKLDAKVNSLLGLLETKTDLSTKFAKGILTDAEVKSELFQRSVKMFDTMKYGAYDTKHERALNRLVSGLPPALFLATDAYNLSRVMDDDPKKADKEKKTRFKQETARILSSGYLTLITLGALNKYINNSKAGIMLMTGGTVLLTEAFSRLINGKHIKRLTPEEARLENQKNDAPEKDIKPDTSFKANPDNSKQQNNQQKPLLSMDTLLKASAVVIAAGYAVKFARKIPAVDKAFKTVQEPFKALYKKLTVIPDYTISKEKFDKIIDVLEKNNFSDLANKYKQVAASHIDAQGMLHLGEKDKKFIKPLVNFFIAPFKFAWNTITLPYRYTDKLVQLLKKKPAVVPKTAEQISKELSKKDLEVLSKTIENIGAEAVKKGMTPEKFQSYVKDNILKAFNATTMSNVSNAELSNLAKTAATAATLWFLMTDNYNMVMLKSNGNDKDGAETKFKERFVQEGSRLFYQTLLIDLFNSTFRSQYNATLAGMSWITLVDTTLGEILTRKSVGMPVRAHSRSELEAIEKKQDEATGFLKGYYNFMRRLTGKRSIASYHVSDKPQVQPQIDSKQFFKGGNFLGENRKAFSELTLKS